ncbi:MAG: hypothetical protein GQ574_03875 [Crocinitomix sp.]|nr:hypothetical protein [Crocinitomix sp.]
MKKILLIIPIIICIISCEGDYDVSYEWIGLKAHNADNSNMWPVKSSADSMSMSTFAIKLVLDADEISRSGRYPDTETPPINANPLDSLVITSDFDFDVSHPAGTNLTDLFVILNDNYFRSLPANGSEGYFITKIYANDFNDQYNVDEIDLLLINNPDFPSFQQFHIYFRLSDGTVFKDSTEIIYLY